MLPHLPAMLQASVEYALKASGSAVSQGGGNAYIGTCRVDGTVLSCLEHSYPRTSAVVVVVLCLFALRVLFARSRRAG
jgi:hypothetical protein